MYILRFLNPPGMTKDASVQCFPEVGRCLIGGMSGGPGSGETVF